MDISLDQERWQLPDDTSLMEALAEVSDKAQLKGCLVTTLVVGGRTITDRDLDPAFLAKRGPEVSPIEATSRSLRTIMFDASATRHRFSAQLRRDGESLIGPLRAGRGGFGALDGWLGRLADYAEMAETERLQGLPDAGGTAVLSWIPELLEARQAGDIVRLADILEYELLPNLVHQEPAR